MWHLQVPQKELSQLTLGEPKRLYEETLSHLAKLPYLLRQDNQGNSGGGLSRVTETIQMGPNFCTY